MNKKRRNLLIIFVVLICLGITFLIVWISRTLLDASKRCQTMSPAASINARLMSELEKGNSHLEEIFSSADEEWRFLSVSDYDKTIMVLDNTRYGLDARRERPLLDPWGNRLVIGYRKSAGGTYESVVVSNGPDGVCGTKDDLIFDSVYINSETMIKRDEVIRNSIKTSLKEEQNE